MREIWKEAGFSDVVNPDTIDAAECYQLAVQKAADYFESLYQRVVHKTYVQFHDSAGFTVSTSA